MFRKDLGCLLPRKRGLVLLIEPNSPLLSNLIHRAKICCIANEAGSGVAQVAPGEPLFRSAAAALRVCVSSPTAASLRAAAAVNRLTDIPADLLALGLADVQARSGGGEGATSW